MSNEVNTPFFIYCFCIFLVYFIKRRIIKDLRQYRRALHEHTERCCLSESFLKSLIILFGLILNGFCCEVSLNHKRDLERDGMVKFSEVESGQLADLLKSVNESVSVNEQLT